MIEQNKKERKQKIEPSETLLFAGIIVKATPKEFERIKQFILTQTTARLIYQHRDERYLMITHNTITKEALLTNNLGGN
jgi:hypothetical protein